MKAVMPDVLAYRRRTGADRWDEMWAGVLHMPPAPNRAHQDLSYLLENWLRKHWAASIGGRVHHEVNVASPGRWPHDYRIPDLVLLKPDRFHVDRNEYFEGAPTAVVEIHCPGDEAYEKLDFYAELAVAEAWIIDRDSRRPEVYALAGGQYVQLEPNAEGWLAGGATGIWLRAVEGQKLQLQLGQARSSRITLPI